MEYDLYGLQLSNFQTPKTPRDLLLSKIISNSALAPFKAEMFGPTPPNIFVGRAGYPSVQVGPLIGSDEFIDASLFDDPKKWYGLPFEEIVKFRSSLIRGKKLSHIKKSRELFDLQDSVLSQKTVDMEVKFKKPPTRSMYFHSVFQPMGPTGEYESLKLASNPSIPKKVDSIVNEDITAVTAFSELMDRNYDIYYLQKLLSAGLLGRQKSKKLVPTRWSITAADKISADIQIEKIRELPQLNEILLYSNTYLANHFEILLLPGNWEYEQFENWESHESTQGKGWFLEHEYEPFEGRSDYAKSEGGGYYAGRHSVAQFLAEKLRRQARAVVIREIHKEYDIPVGVWEIRENVAHAFENPPIKLESMRDAKLLLDSRLQNPAEMYFQKSRILPQRKLMDYS